MISDRIIVGVDGSPGACAAVDWAVDECRVRRCPLLIVHAPDPGDLAFVANVGDPAVRALNDVGEALLRQHAARASARQPSIIVSTLLSPGRPADALIDISQDAELLVVGTRGRGGITMTLLGSVSHRVAAHAHCPVAVVPESLAPSSSPSPRVVVGVSHAAASRRALQFAAREATLLRGSVQAIRALGDESRWLAQVEPAAAARARVEEQRFLDSEVERVRQMSPDARIEAVVADGEPAEALLKAAESAHLVVVGAHHSEDRWSTRLGPVPAAILHRTACPVVVVGGP